MDNEMRERNRDVMQRLSRRQGVFIKHLSAAKARRAAEDPDNACNRRQRYFLNYTKTPAWTTQN
ncbi:MAG: hypothetical protein EPN89_06070 [Methylovulum sp.]|nr:MAG: hypothetical protein EPN89_06070 [Methylovulum sp.]